MLAGWSPSKIKPVVIWYWYTEKIANNAEKYHKHEQPRFPKAAQWVLLQPELHIGQKDH